MPWKKTNNFHIPIDSSLQYNFNETILHFRLPPEVLPVMVEKLKNYVGFTINIFELDFRIQFLEFEQEIELEFETRFQTRP